MQLALRQKPWQVGANSTLGSYLMRYSFLAVASAALIAACSGGGNETDTYGADAADHDAYINAIRGEDDVDEDGNPIAPPPPNGRWAGGQGQPGQGQYAQGAGQNGAPQNAQGQFAGSVAQPFAQGAGNQQMPAAAPGLQRAQIIDQNGFERPMLAYTVSIPAGWRLQGGVDWRPNQHKCGRISPSVEWQAVAPDGIGRVEMLAGENWMGHNLPTGIPGYEQCPNVQINDTKQFVTQYAQRLRPGARVLDYMDRSNEVQQLKSILPTPMNAPGGMQSKSWVGAGQALIGYAQNGQEVRELIGTAVLFNHTRMPDGMGGAMEYITLTALPGFSMRTLNGKLDLALAETIRTSIAVDPAYEKRMAEFQRQQSKIIADGARKSAAINAKGGADRSAIIAKNGQDVLDIQMQTYRNSTASGDYIQRESSEAIRGVETYNDNYNGGTVELDNNYQYNYQLENGDIVQTNDANYNVYQETGQFGAEMEPEQ
jgi:hypothetical protein